MFFSPFFSTCLRNFRTFPTASHALRENDGRERENVGSHRCIKYFSLSPPSLSGGFNNGIVRPDEKLNRTTRSSYGSADPKRKYESDLPSFPFLRFFFFGGVYARFLIELYVSTSTRDETTRDSDTRYTPR